MNQRRTLVAALGAMSLAPFAALAQPKTRVWHIGLLTLRRRPDSLDSGVFGAFLRGMRELGYVEGSNLHTEWRFAEGQPARLAAMAAELVQLKVDIIVTGGTLPTAAAQAATTSVPIVIASAGDPLASGFVKSLARPGGNITGRSENAVETAPKLLQLLTSMRPKLALVGVMTNPDNPALLPRLKAIESAARTLRLAVLHADARNASEIEVAFATLAQKKVEALIVPVDQVYIAQWRQIAELAVRYRLPSIGGEGAYPHAGGLLSYGPDHADNYRRAAIYVDKILKGAKPADLPVEEPTRFELIVNRKTAQTLGLTIPQSVLISAEKLIE